MKFKVNGEDMKDDLEQRVNELEKVVATLMETVALMALRDMIENDELDEFEEFVNSNATNASRKKIYDFFKTWEL